MSDYAGRITITEGCVEEYNRLPEKCRLQAQLLLKKLQNDPFDCSRPTAIPAEPAGCRIFEAAIKVDSKTHRVGLIFDVLDGGLIEIFAIKHYITL